MVVNLMEFHADSPFSVGRNAGARGGRTSAISVSAHKFSAPVLPSTLETSTLVDRIRYSHSSCADTRFYSA